MTDLLVIGYGNTLRSDDGVGPRVSDAVAALQLPDVRTITCGLLAPELAEPVSRARRVVFVDAAIDVPVSSGVLLRDLLPAESSLILAHSAEPKTLLALARDVFGHAPKAWWLTIPAVELGIGEQMSPETEAGFTRAVEIVRDLASQRQT